MKLQKKSLVLAVLAAFAVGAVSAQSASQPAAAAAGGKAPYTVVDGNKVDAGTLEGWRTWRAAACDRCHGANQEGLVGPSLVTSLKTLSKDEFVKVVMNGRPNTQMVAFSGNPTVTKNMDNLYAYLKGRSDGAIKTSRVEAMK